MKLTTMTQVTVDGVMQGNGGASDEDRRNGFERGGWAMGVGDNETMTFINQTYQRADAFLFGRRTYELFAPYWGAIDPGSGPIADALNTKPKYVASTTLTEPRWADTTVLSGDLAAAIGRLKARPAGELQVHGSGALIRWLLENDLVDEMNLLIVPVVLGQGTRLFPATGPDIALDLVDSRADSKGVTIQACRPGARSMQPAEARDVGDALDDRPVPAVWPRPAHAGNEKYLAGFRIVEASGLDVALKLAAEASKACNRKIEVRRNAAKAAGRAYGRRRCPAMASTSRIVDNRRARKS
jgi:dihydrofolate reductase